VITLNNPGHEPDFSLSSQSTRLRSARRPKFISVFHPVTALFRAVISRLGHGFFSKTFMVILTLLFTALHPANGPALSSLEQLHQNGVLRVGISLPSDVHSPNLHPSNIMVEVLQTFANELQVSLQLIAITPTNKDSLLNDKNTPFDMIVTTSQEHPTLWRYTNPVLSIDHFIVHHKETQLPEATLKKVSSAKLEEPKPLTPLSNHIISGRTPIFELFYRVSNGQLPYTLAYSHEYEVYRHFVDDLKGVPLGPAQKFRWAFRSLQSHDLHTRAQKFIQSMHDNHRLKELQARFFWNDPALNKIERRYFVRRVQSRLPKFLELFQDAGSRTGIDWRLLAAMSYQESHWNPKAISPTGVGGLMMLTKSTAKEVGVTNRMAPNQSIQGGADYFKKQKAKLPDFVSEPDRTWMALAAYNLGMQTVTKAIKRAQYHGDSPTDWFSVQKHLSAFEQTIPTVSGAQYLKGAAQGIHYVKNIRLFYDLLQQPNLVENSQSPKAINLAMIKETPPVYNSR